MLHYQTHLNNITSDQLKGFFVGWPNSPTEAGLLQILQSSAYIVLAIKEGNGHNTQDEQGSRVVGFVNALSDRLQSAYIPNLEVLPDYQGQGVGKELMKRLLNQLNHLYMIDLCCDETLTAYYEGLGFQKVAGMIRRNYSQQGMSHISK